MNITNLLKILYLLETQDRLRSSSICLNLNISRSTLVRVINSNLLGVSIDFVESKKNGFYMISDWGWINKNKLLLLEINSSLDISKSNNVRTDRVEKLIIYIHKNSVSTHSEIAKELGISTVSAKRLLTDTAKLTGFTVEKSGKKYGTYYISDWGIFNPQL